jgi:hypothetical protein
VSGIHGEGLEARKSLSCAFLLKIHLSNLKNSLKLFLPADYFGLINNFAFRTAYFGRESTNKSGIKTQFHVEKNSCDR